MIDRVFARNITVYHVNEMNYSSTPLNMNTADVLGDMYFTLRSRGLPAECGPWRNESWWSHLDCNDAEVSSTDLAVTKLVVEVDSRFGTYADCNLDSGTYFCTCDNALSNCSAQPSDIKCSNSYGCEWAGEYCVPYLCPNMTKASQCEQALFDCVWDGSKQQCSHNASVPLLTCNATKVGMQNCSDWDTIYSRYTKHRKPQTTEVDLYHENTVHKVGGLWFSTEAEGQCLHDAKSTKPCTWRVVKVVKKVSKECSDATIDAAVMTSEAAGGQSCFSQCPQAHNTSSICWIRCFYQTVLGEDSGSRLISYANNRSSPSNPTTGMALSELVAAWERPFASTDPSKGGCPDLR